MGVCVWVGGVVLGDNVMTEGLESLLYVYNSLHYHCSKIKDWIKASGLEFRPSTTSSLTCRHYRLSKSKKLSVP